MKNIYKYIFAAMLTLGATTSCSDFLDEAPKRTRLLAVPMKW